MARNPALEGVSNRPKYIVYLPATNQVLIFRPGNRHGVCFMLLDIVGRAVLAVGESQQREAAERGNSRLTYSGLSVKFGEYQA
jgi:hypothetical protein